MKGKWFLAAGLGAVLLAAAVFYRVSGEGPVATLKNVGSDAVTELEIRTGVEASYAIGKLDAGESSVTPLSGGDRLLWIVGKSASGEVLESNKVYVAIGASVSGVSDGHLIILAERR